MLENPGRVAVLVLDKFHLVLEHVSILVHNLFHRSNTSKSEFKIAHIVQTYCRIIIRPHRINLPSARFQWRKYEREKIQSNCNSLEFLKKQQNRDGFQIDSYSNVFLDVVSPPPRKA